MGLGMAVRPSFPAPGCPCPTQHPGEAAEVEEETTRTKAFVPNRDVTVPLGEFWELTHEVTQS